MTALIVAELGKISPKIKTALQEIKKEIETKKEIEGNQFNIESLLSSVEAKKEVIGTGSLNGLNVAEFGDLVTSVMPHRLFFARFLEYGLYLSLEVLSIYEQESLHEDHSTINPETQNPSGPCG